MEGGTHGRDLVTQTVPRELLQIVGEIYEASYAPAHWVEVLRLVAEATGSKSASLMYRDLEYEQASFAFAHGVETDAAVVRNGPRKLDSVISASLIQAASLAAS